MLQNGCLKIVPIFPAEYNVIRKIMTYYHTDRLQKGNGRTCTTYGVKADFSDKQFTGQKIDIVFSSD